MKRDILDDLFSQLVRERAGWTCECCGKYYPEGNRMGLHCSHIFSRRYKGTRWEPSNAVAHCFGCHQRLGGNPIEFAEWATSHLGGHVVEMLREKAHRITKLRDADKAALKAHLRDQLKQMREKRQQGETGRIEFEGFL
jgi:hypothetical protein